MLVETRGCVPYRYQAIALGLGRALRSRGRRRCQGGYPACDQDRGSALQPHAQREHRMRLKRGGSLVS